MTDETPEYETSRVGRAATPVEIDLATAMIENAQLADDWEQTAKRLTLLAKRLALALHYMHPCTARYPCSECPIDEDLRRCAAQRRLLNSDEVQALLPAGLLREI